MVDVAPPTVGMHIDALLAQLGAVSSSGLPLYAAVIAASLTFAIQLVNSGRGASPPKLLNDSDAGYPHKPTRRRAPGDAPEPKWWLLRLTNYVVATAFVCSMLLCYAFLDDSALLACLAALCVVYFVGFFGISFVEVDDFADRPAPPRRPLARRSRKYGSAGHSGSATPKVVRLPPPVSSAPVCTDPSSFVKPSAGLPSNLKELPNRDIAALVLQDQIKDHQLEKLLDPHRAVEVRRLKFAAHLGGALAELPHAHALDYKRVLGANCEIVVGYVPIPVGIAGPVTLNGEAVYIPMATTEGCLVASTNRGCKAISQGGGASSVILRDGITRAPCVRLPSATEAAEVALWIGRPENFLHLKTAFEATTGFGKLLRAQPTVAGKNVYIRLCCFAGDAMGMNMVSKGSLAVIEALRQVFPELSLLALSGNMCTDKKAAAINWIEGRGKSVVIEATIPKEVVRATLKTSVPAIVETNVNKNLIGSAMAGAVGGFNAHAANNVTAVFLATGQDPAQAESSNCITLMEENEDGGLWISCTMPSIEVGTVGGGTGLPAQAACLKAIGVKGGGATPGDNARQLAHVVAAAVLAGELSLMAALASNSLVAAHMAHNRKPATK